MTIFDNNRFTMFGSKHKLRKVQNIKVLFGYLYLELSFHTNPEPMLFVKCTGFRKLEVVMLTKVDQTI